MQTDLYGVGNGESTEIDAADRPGRCHAARIDYNTICIIRIAGRSRKIPVLRQPSAPVAHIRNGAVPRDGGTKRSDTGGTQSRLVFAI